MPSDASNEGSNSMISEDISIASLANLHILCTLQGQDLHLYLFGVGDESGRAAWPESAAAAAGVELK